MPPLKRGKQIVKRAYNRDGSDIRAPLVKGEPDPMFPQFKWVPVDKAPKHPYFKRLDMRYNFPETYYRWDPKAKYVRCLVTTMPDGTHVAWDTCSGCHHYFTGCTCPKGVRTCRSVEYIHDMIGARGRGEDWGMTHPDYRGSLTRAERQARKEAPERFISPARVVLVPPGDSGPSTGRTRPVRGTPLRKPGAQMNGTPVPGPRKLLRKSTVEGLKDAIDNVDLDAMTGAAAEMVDNLTKAIIRKEDRKGKTLRKSSTRPPTPLVKRTAGM